MFCFTESRKIHLPFHKKVFVIVHGIFVSSSFSYVIVKSHLINEKPKNFIRSMDDMVPERENAFDANEAKTHEAT